jgi:alpha-tubulin suppressor-like RCC1 family protein
MSSSSGEERNEIVERRLSSIETELEQVEVRLSVMPHRSTAATAPTAGRAVFDSISTALGSIRSRLNAMGGNGLSDQETEISTVISERLRNAERAHSARIPLGMLHQELSRRRDSVNSSNVSQKEEEEQKNSGSTRRASVLLASRRLADAAEGHQADMDLHGASMASLLPDVELEEEKAREVKDILSPVKELEDEDKSEEMKIRASVETSEEEKAFEAMDVDNDENADETMDVDDDHGEDDVPILLSRNSLSNLDNARRSVLFHKSESQKSLTFTSDTIVYSWGSGVNSLHDDTDDKTAEQARVKPDSRVGRSDVVSAAAGLNHAACSISSGEVLVCGRNAAGAVDPDRKANVIIGRPVSLESLTMSRIVQVSCGLEHTAALRSNGAVLTWGSNEYGQLGHRRPFRGPDAPPAPIICRPTMMVLGPGRRATSVACGDGFTLVLTSRMGVLACGVEVIAGHSREQGALHLPAPIPALEDLPIVSVAAGHRHAVAVTAHGSAFAWGENSHGCLGREYPKATSVPVPIGVNSSISPPSGSMLPAPLSHWAYWDGESGHASIANDIAVVDAACGGEHTVLVTRSGRLLVCGSNSKGQLGMDPKLKKAVHHVEPVHHPNLTDGRFFVRAEAGEGHTLLLDNACEVWQLGGDSASGPMRLLEGKNIQWIAAGGNQNIAAAANPGHILSHCDLSDQEVGKGADLAQSVEDLVEELKNDMNVNAEESGEEQPFGVGVKELFYSTEELLKAPAVLNSLLHPTELEDLFKMLLSADSQRFRQGVAFAIERGIQKGLDTLRADDARLMYPEQVRFLLLYIQCPLFVDDNGVDFDHRGDLILSLCETILGLSYEGYKALLSWATSIYPRELFVRLLVRPLIKQLEKGLSVEAGAGRRPVPAIVGVLRWLHKASERAGDIASPEDFYCGAIGNTDPRWLVEDLVRYKEANKHQRAAHFFLCDNPFLFSPSTKRRLLQIESEMNMLKVAATGLTYNAEARTFEFDPFYVLDVDREHILPQTLQKVAKAEPSDLRKKLRVVFKGEDGVDAGGVTREFFQLLSAQLFDVSSGMWSTRFQGEQITWFNSDCTWNDEGYYLVGILVGLAVYNSVLLDVHFPQAVYRKLMGLSLGLEDLPDEDVKTGFQKLLDYEGDDVEDIFCLTFDVAWMDLGEEKKRELKLGGSDIAVTTDNKEEYVLLYVKWLLVDSIYPQYDAFERGFMRVMENSSLDLLRPEDLELLVVGSPELDFRALEKNADYEGGYDKESDVVRHFWRFVQNALPETQMKLLMFTTGSSKAPIGGLGELSFKIQKAGPDSMLLPSSHTCFNTLLLPDYGDNYEKLEDRLGRAIIECEGFGLQ